MALAVDLSDSDWFATLWPVFLVPVAWLFGRIMDRTLEQRVTAAPSADPPQVIFEHARKVSAAAEASARADASATASASATAAAKSRSTDETDDVWEELAKVGLIAAAVVFAFSIVGIFFAGVRLFALSATLAFYGVVIGYVFACVYTLHRSASLDGSWYAVLGLVAFVAVGVALGPLWGLIPSLPEGRYEQMLEYFDRRGRDGLRGFGLLGTSVYLGFQALSVLILIAVALALAVFLAGLMAMRFEDALGLLPRAK